MKQVLVVNSDLALPAGKMAAQVAHASIAAFLIADNANRQEWLDVGMPKIVLAGENEAQMHLLLRQAREAGVPAYLVRDAGRTVVPEGTVTCLGLGPAPMEDIDAFTGQDAPRHGRGRRTRKHRPSRLIRAAGAGA
jgi:PTH2 family peptidyl-tRNA hydrolase